MNKNIISAEWVRYRDQVYPQGVGGVQEKETKQAFCAGVIVAISCINAVSVKVGDTIETCGLPKSDYDEVMNNFITSVMAEAIEINKAAIKSIEFQKIPNPSEKNDQS